MSYCETLTAKRLAEPSIRAMSENDLFNIPSERLPGCLTFVPTASREPWDCRELLGWTAEVCGKTIGTIAFAAVGPKWIYRNPGPLTRLTRIVEHFLGLRNCDRPRYIELLYLVVEPEPAGMAATDILLKRLLDTIWRLWGEVPVVLPESNLSAQVCFRNARYKAVRVLHGYFGDEDGYLMIQDVDGHC